MHPSPLSLSHWFVVTIIVIIIIIERRVTRKTTQNKGTEHRKGSERCAEGAGNSQQAASTVRCNLAACGTSVTSKFFTAREAHSPPAMPGKQFWGIWGLCRLGAEGMSLQVASAPTSKFAAKKLSPDAWRRTGKKEEEMEAT